MTIITKELRRRARVKRVCHVAKNDFAAHKLAEAWMRKQIQKDIDALNHRLSMNGNRQVNCTGIVCKLVKTHVPSDHYVVCQGEFDNG